jgi:hypothetical protein
MIQSTTRLSRGARLRRPRPLWVYGVTTLAGFVATCDEKCVGGPGPDSVILDDLSVGSLAGRRSCCGAAAETARA